MRSATAPASSAVGARTEYPSGGMAGVTSSTQPSVWWGRLLYHRRTPGLSPPDPPLARRRHAGCPERPTPQRGSRRARSGPRRGLFWLTPAVLRHPVTRHAQARREGDAGSVAVGDAVAGPDPALQRVRGPTGVLKEGARAALHATKLPLRAAPDERRLVPASRALCQACAAARGVGPAPRARARRSARRSKPRGAGRPRRTAAAPYR
jgi:hypothetical protein